MKKNTVDQTILKYLKQLNQSEWINNESYKFKFANYLQSNINFEQQSDDEIFSILLKSQTIRYHKAPGIQFIKKGGRKTLSEFLTIKDVALFRQYQNLSFEEVNWSNRSMSYTILSAWLSSLFPDKIFPVPITGLNETINYLFETDLSKTPKTGVSYISFCQAYMLETENELKKYPIEEIHLKTWNKYFNEQPQLNIKSKTSFTKVDWNWLTQDLHLFIYRNILKLYRPKGGYQIAIIKDDDELSAMEGQTKLSTHLSYERNSALIKRIKEKALKSNPMLNCESCGFSFFEKYGEFGHGFIEAHHKYPLHQSKGVETKESDIALLCSNCHKMIHRGVFEQINRILTIDELKEMIVQ